jgi:PKD repeat protein
MQRVLSTFGVLWGAGFARALGRRFLPQLLLAVLAVPALTTSSLHAQARPPLPTIAAFQAERATIQLGESVTLNWSVSGATTLNVSGVGDVTGSSVTVTPTATTTYKLTATNARGSRTATVRVTVVVPPATIAAFTATPASVPLGSASTLTWDVAGATSVTINNGVGTVTGNSVSVSPTATTTYTLVAKNAGGSAKATARVTVVVPPPVISSFTATPESIPLGSATTLSWSVAGATSVSINNGVGTVTGNSVSVSPTKTTTYTLSARNAGGTVTATARVSVAVPPPVISSFSASPASITAGESTTLSWSVAGATSLSINNGVGTVTGSSVTVSPTQTTTYTLTARNAGGTVTSSTRVTVAVAPPVISSFSASPAAITAGQSSTLSWSVSGASSVSIDQGVGTVSGSSVSVSPAASTTYTLTARNAAGAVTASTAVAVAPANGAMKYQVAYDSALLGSWIRSCWESESAPIYSNFSAPAPGGRAGNAIEVRFGPENGSNAFGLADRKPGWDTQDKYLNEFRTIEFDLWVDADATGMENLEFIFEDAFQSDDVKLVNFIPGWFQLSPAERVNRWFHVVIDLQAINPKIIRFHQFLFFNAGNPDSQPHFRLANVRLGYVDDLTPPVVTFGAATPSVSYDAMTLTFTTNEHARYRVEYGRDGYTNTFEGPGDWDGWVKSHSATLVGLQPGVTYAYRIVAFDHRTEPGALPNLGYHTGTFTMPAAPTTPPVLSGLTATNVTGNSATLVWQTNRPTKARLAYRKVGGAELVRTFDDFAASRSVLADLLEPQTAYEGSVTVTDAFDLSTTQAIAFTTNAAGAPTVTIAVNPAQTRPISPWIYGMNFYQDTASQVRNLTFNRQGGNRWTAYNWENNASNSGRDWGPYSNDNYLGGDTIVPGEAVRSLIAQDRARGSASLITVQLQGYVAADKNGLVDITAPNYLAERFRPVVYRKGTPFTATPSTTDNAVYMDEFLWALRSKFAGNIYADPATPTFVSLDNEPDLWAETHPQIQPHHPTAASFIEKSIALARAVKDVDSNIQLFGPVNYGISGFINWQGSPGYTENYWFMDQYLQAMKAASDADNRRLLDVFDFHWYSEAYANNERIIFLSSPNLNATQIQEIVQSPRSLWDPTYAENSWIVSYFGGPVRILPRLEAKIAAGFPGTKLAITEYDNGGHNHIAGAIAQADNLGIFGAHGVFAANYWPMAPSYPFVQGAFKMYRDYDGSQSAFGDISVAATSSNVAKVAAYVSRDSKNPNRLVIVVINRSFTAEDVSFNGLAASGNAKVYRMETNKSSPVFVGSVPVNLSNWVVSLPALSVSTIEIAP